jgi:hypothetical protein
MTTKILSYGGGLDSFAMLVNAIERGELPHYCVFADTGSGTMESESKDGEWPGTYRHMKEVAIPLAEKHGIQFIWITHEDYPVRGMSSLLEYFKKAKTIPTRGARSCTHMAKVERVSKWMKAVVPGRREVWIGFEAGEEDRAAKDPHATKTCGDGAWRSNRFPLMEAKLCRCRAELMIRKAGFPVPRKSACVFCPYSKVIDFRTLSQQLPDVYEGIVEWESVSGTTKAGEKLWLAGEEPLPEELARDVGYMEIECMVCGRFPRASKMSGIDYLRPDEYCSVDEPGPPALRYYTKGAKKGLPVVYAKGKKKGEQIPRMKRIVPKNPARQVRIEADHVERTVAGWLAGRLIGPQEGVDVAGGDVLVLEGKDIAPALELLMGYAQMVKADPDRDDRHVVTAALSLAAKIREAS